MKTAEVRKRYLDFMQSKGHTVVPSSRLVPENDPTTLFTGSGMQPMIQYLLGAKHPQGTRITDSQKCFRADDIEEVGDNRHTTFFEMLGNWSFGDYFKEEQIEWMWEFIIKELGLDPNRLYITVFGGDEAAGVPKDEDAPQIWQKLFSSVGIEAGIADIGSEEAGGKRGMKQGERIFYYESKKNWWSRAGIPANMPAGEPGGPDSEMFYEFTDIEHDTAFGAHCHPNCDCGRFVEIGNNVFMQYIRQEDGSFIELENKNIDFGGGLERLVAATNDDPDVFTIDTLGSIVTFLEKVGDKKYADEVHKYAFRVVADHMRAAVFMIGDDILPSNTEQGYFVRRLIRRSVRFADTLGVKEGVLGKVADTLVSLYEDQYPELATGRIAIREAIEAEELKFRKTLEKGLHEFEKIKSRGLGKISGHDAFILFTTYGFPMEVTEELAQESGLTLDKDAFQDLMTKHKEESRAGAEQKFKGGLADHSEATTAYHTATHLMLAGLRRELGDTVTQRGSNITAERARFDVNHHEPISREVLDKVEEYVNAAMQAGAKVFIEEMPKDEAKESGAVGAFWEKYPDVVTVYNIKDDTGTVYSRELCGGPHVENTQDIAQFGTFKIMKESSSSAGVRRIKAILE
jgi:alanyl-tRNA synthetase